MASQGSSRGAAAGSKRKAVDRDDKPRKAAKAYQDREAQVGKHMAFCCCAQANAGKGRCLARHAGTLWPDWECLKMPPGWA